jgi:hypothetical protein
VILDRENGADLYAERLGFIIAALDLDDEQRAQLRQRLAYYEFPKIRDYDRADLVAEVAAADLVVFDSQRRFLTDMGLDEDSSDDYAKFVAAAVDPLFEAGIATLIQDNTGHSDATRGRGSSAKADLNEVSFILETVEPYSTARVGKIRLRLEPGASRFGGEGTWEMTIGGGVFGPWEHVQDQDASLAEYQERQEDALTWIRAYVTDHPGTPKTDAVKAFADHHGKGGKALGSKVIDRALTGSTPELSKGPGKAANGVYLYPAPPLSFPLPEPTTGSTESTPSGPTLGGELSASHRAIESAGSGKHLPEGDLSDHDFGAAAE